MASSLRDLANSVQKRKTEQNYLNEVVNDKILDKLKKSKEIIDEAYVYFDKYQNNKKVPIDYKKCILLLLGLAFVFFLIKQFGKPNLFFVCLMLLAFIITLVIYEKFIFKPYRLKVKAIDEEEIKGLKLLQDNKDTLSIIGVHYWFPLAINYIIDTASKNKDILLKDLLLKADEYIIENTKEQKDNKSKKDEKIDVSKINYYEIENEQYEKMQAQSFKLNKRSLKGTENMDLKRRKS